MSGVVIAKGRGFRVIHGDLYAIQVPASSLNLIWWGSPKVYDRRRAFWYWLVRRFFLHALSEHGVAICSCKKSELTSFINGFEKSIRYGIGKPWWNHYLKSRVVPYIRKIETGKRGEVFWPLVFYLKQSASVKGFPSVIFEKPIEMKGLEKSMEMKWRRTDLCFPDLLINTFTAPGDTILDLSSGYEALDTMALARGRKVIVAGRNDAQLDTVIASMNDLEAMMGGGR